MIYKHLAISIGNTSTSNFLACNLYSVRCTITVRQNDFVLKAEADKPRSFHLAEMFL